MKRFEICSLTKDQKNTRKRILEISYNQKLSHIGSCLGVIDIIDAIYKTKRKSDKFVLSNGHAGIAYYVILEKYKKIKDKKLIKELHIHPDRNPKLDIHVSSGSLGLGLSVALGMAFANRKMSVYCTISDGECAEGSIWEALRIASDHNLSNLKIVVNANGWGAYGEVELKKLFHRLNAFGCKTKEVDGHNLKQLISTLKIKSKKPLLIFAHTRSDQFPFLRDLDAHYYAMNENDYNKALKLLL